MSRSGKFMDIFGDLNRDDDIMGAVPPRSSSHTSTGNGVFSYPLEEYERGFHNRGFLGDDDHQDAAVTSAPNAKTAQSPRTCDNATANPTSLQSDYNPYDHPTHAKHPTSFGGTIFHIYFLSAGSTVLLLPRSYVATGFITATLVMVLIFTFYVYSMRTLLWSAHQMCQLKRVPTLSYGNLVYEAFDAAPPALRPLASAARLLINGIFFAGWFGCCVLVYLLIAQNVRTILCDWWPATAALCTQRTIVLLLFAPILLPSLLRRLKSLEPCSVLGCALNALAILLVVYYALTDSTPWKGSSLAASDTSTVSQFMGVIFLNINTTGLMISLKNEMQHPQRFDAPCGVLSIAYTLILATYFTFSIFFVLKYGSDVPENAITIIPSNLWLSLCTLLCYVLGLYLLFPLVLYVPLDILWSVGTHKDEDGITCCHKNVCQYALCIGLVALATLLSYFVPSIRFFVSLFGAVASSVDSVIFPAVVQSLVEWQIGERGKMTAFVLVKNLIVIIMGGCFMVAGIGDCLREL